MIGWLIGSGAYTVLAALTGRNCYGRLRAMAIKDVGLRWTRDEDYLWIVGTGTILSTTLWPVALLVLAVFANPPKTPEELKAQLRKQDQYIKELERENLR